MPLRHIERAALGVIWVGIGLILLIPLAVSGESAFFPLVVNDQAVLFPPTIFPYLVGKALLFRCLVEIVFVAWTVLAVLNPTYRPTRSLLLGLLAVALGVALVSALLGVSVVRSLFSTYERMGGVLDQAHWFAFAVVLVSVVRLAQWRILLNANLGVGMVIALWAVGQHFDVEALLWGWSKEGYGRITATLGNPIHLGAYVLVNSLVAAGFFVESLLGKTPVDPGGAVATYAEGTQRKTTTQDRIRTVVPWLWRLFWGLCALLSAWVVTLTAARSAFLGLIAGFAAVAVLFAYLERGRARLAVGAMAGLLAAVVVAFALAVGVFERDPESQRARSSNPLIERTLSFSKRTVQTRLAAWDAAVEGFLERPVLGWGPDNYVVVLGRHGSGMGADMRIHDNAHGRLAEELATKGSLGVVSHLALWAGLLVVGLQAARRMGRRERIPLVFAGGGLVGYFAHALVSPEVVTGTLQFTLLLAFVAVVARERASAPLSSWLSRLATTIRNRANPLRGWVKPPILGGAAVAVSASLAAVGLWTNHAAFSSASVGALAIRSSEPALGIAPHYTREFFAEAIDTFEPMGNQFRLFLFQYARNQWRFLRTVHRAESARLLALVDAEAPAAIRLERENWEIPMSLAEMYIQVSATNPQYRAAAIRQTEAARELAPNRYEVRALGSP